MDLNNPTVKCITFENDCHIIIENLQNEFYDKKYCILGHIIKQAPINLATHAIQDW